MSRKIRTFVAIELPGQLKRALTKLTKQLAPLANNVRWIDPENMHITLVFLGDVEDYKTHEACRAVTQACSAIEPFPVKVESVGVLPKPQKPRVFCAKISVGSEELTAMRETVADALDEARFQFDWKFTPHITIGRVGRGRFDDIRLVEKMSDYDNTQFGEFQVHEVVVNSSLLEKSGPVYVRLSAASLDG